MKILECREPSNWAVQIRQIQPMEKCFFRVEDLGKVKNSLNNLRRLYGLRYINRRWDNDYFVLIILEEWR